MPGVPDPNSEWDLFGDFEQMPALDEGPEGAQQPPAHDLSDEALLSGLNPAQREAVLHTDGPLVVVAGAWSSTARSQHAADPPAV